jgi:transposase
MNLRQENERLKQENAELRGQLQDAERRIQDAERRIQELSVRLNQDSSNSNWPSSRDKSRAKRQKRTRSLRKKSGKKAGGQKGHEGHTLEFSDQPDVIETHRPTQCEHCQAPFSEEQHRVALDKRQVYDLPPLDLIVCEHQAETLICAHCGEMTMGAFPEEVKAPVQYGPRVQQLAVYLRTEQFVPYKRSRQLLADLFGAYLSTGTLQTMVRKASTRLKEAVAAIKEGLTASEVVHFDESGFYIKGKRNWLHTAGTAQLTLYFPHERRGKKATDAMGVLPAFPGTAVHDFWSTYRQHTQCSHSLCNAHHLREFTAVVENDGQRWAQHFKSFLVSAKHTVEKAQAEGRTSLPQEKIEQIERLYSKLIEAGLNANPPPAEGWPRGKRGRVKKTKARNLVERLDKYRQEALAFVYDFKVPFDNNLAERDIRMLKVQQKISGTFRSQLGAEDFCTIRSYTSTMRKQGVNSWAALGSVFSADLMLPQTIPE